MIDVTPRACQTSILTMARGGTRDGAGRKSAFPGKDLARIFGMDFTAAGREALARLEEKHGLSRNDIMAHLALAHADQLTFDTAGVVFPGKLAKNVLSIRLPPNAGEKLSAARERTGKGYSDLGEALVTLYGETETYPARPVSDRPRKPRPPRKRARARRRA